MYSSKAITRILKYNPDSKFIIIVRNPFERIHSHYHDLQNWVKNIKLKSVDEDIVIKRFGISIVFNLYKNSMYHKKIQFIKSKTDRVLVLALDDLQSGGYSRMLEFIDPNYKISNFEPIYENKRNVVRSIALNNLIGSEHLRNLSSWLPIRGQKILRLLYHRISSANTTVSKKKLDKSFLESHFSQEMIEKLSLDYKKTIEMTK